MKLGRVLHGSLKKARGRRLYQALNSQKYGMPGMAPRLVVSDNESPMIGVGEAPIVQTGVYIFGTRKFI